MNSSTIALDYNQQNNIEKKKIKRRTIELTTNRQKGRKKNFKIKSKRVREGEKEIEKKKNEQKEVRKSNFELRKIKEYTNRLHHKCTKHFKSLYTPNQKQLL